MAIELEGLEFQIEAQADEGVKHIDTLAESLGKIKKAVKGGLGLGSSVKQLEKLNTALSGFHSEKLESLSKALGTLSGAKATIPVTLPKRITELGTSLQSLNDADIDRLERVSNVLHGMGDLSNVKIPKVNVPTTGVAPTMTTPGNSATDAVDSGVEQATSSVQQTTAAIDQAARKTNFLKSILSGIGGAFSKGFSLGTGALHKLGNALTKVKTAAAKAKTAMSKLKNMLGSALAAKVKQTTSGLGQMFSSFKRIAMYRLIRAFLSALTKALQEGINNLYQYSNAMGGTFAQSMDRLATSSQYLKNSLGAMAAPIINALAPAIDFVIDKIVTLLNYINMLFARLSGASVFTAAKKQAKSYGDSLAGAGGSAAKAAKEIRDATTGIDELNIIMEKDNSGGGGGGAGTDYGSMFEELPIDNSISEFADKLKAAFEAADWKGLGTILGDKVNELIDSVNWEGVGSKIGYWLNAAVQTAYYFLDTVNFTNIGTHLAELINSGLEQVDFTYVGRIVVKWFTLIPDMVIGFLTELDWGLVAKSISDFFIGAFNEATDWLNKYDWGELGTILWRKIKDTISNIDWGGLAKSIFTFLGTAIRSAAQFLGGFFGSIAEDIQNWWNEDIKGADWKETAGNLLKAIGKGFKNIGTWVWDNIINPFGQALLGEKWDDVKEVGSNLIGKIKEGWDSVCTLAKNVGEFFVNVKNNAASWWNSVKSWWSGEVGAVKEFTTNVTNNVSTWWSNVKSWWAGKVGAVQNFTTNVANQATTWWNNTKTWWSGKVGAVKEFTTTVTNQAATWWSNVKTWWSGKVGAVQQFTTSVKNEASTWWSNVKTWWSGKVGAVQQFTTSVANQASTWWNNVKSWWSGKVGAVQQFTTSVRNDASTWWSNVKTWWAGKVGNLSVGVSIINAASTWWNNVKTWWSNAVGTLWTTLNIKLPHIEVNWGTITAFGKSFNYPKGFSLKWYAKGGILDGAQIFGMMGNNFLGGGEAGREAVLPLENHTEWMDTLADKVRNGLPDDDHDGISYEGFRRALADFYEEYVQSTMSQMANDMNRQANKKEQTTVQIGNKTVTDAVVTQQNANGYRFTT